MPLRHAIHVVPWTMCRALNHPPTPASKLPVVIAAAAIMLAAMPEWRRLGVLPTQHMTLKALHVRFGAGLSFTTQFFQSCPLTALERCNLLSGGVPNPKLSEISIGEPCRNRPTFIVAAG